MTDICRLTISELDGVLATRPREPELSMVKALRDEAERLAAAVASWAKEAGFPFAFVSDADGKIGKAYGALTALRFGFSKRLLFVVGPDGKVAYKATPFRQSSAEAYTELAQAIDKVAPK